MFGPLPAGSAQQASPEPTTTSKATVLGQADTLLSRIHIRELKSGFLFDRFAAEVGAGTVTKGTALKNAV